MPRYRNDDPILGGEQSTIVQPFANCLSILQKKMEAMSVDSYRVRELEAELDGIRNAFKDYVTSSRDMETGLDHELGDMRKFL